MKYSCKKAALYRNKIESDPLLRLIDKVYMLKY